VEAFSLFCGPQKYQNKSSPNFVSIKSNRQFPFDFRHMLSKTGIAAIALAVILLVVAVVLCVYYTTRPKQAKIVFNDNVTTSWKRRHVISSPKMEIIEQFISPSEIKELLDMVKHKFRRSEVVLLNGSQIPDKDRTSFSVFLQKGETPLIKTLEQRASQATGIPLENLEPLQVVRYEHGQFYKPHFDYLPVTDAVRRNGQRKATVFVYLNDMPPQETGGGTHFPELNITIKPECGNAAFWMNQTPDGNVDPRTLHGGQTIERLETVKYGMNIWFRDHKYVD
jgi:prolyl 4-hydroxylase